MNRSELSIPVDPDSGRTTHSISALTRSSIRREIRRILDKSAARWRTPIGVAFALALVWLVPSLGSLSGAPAPWIVNLAGHSEHSMFDSAHAQADAITVFLPMSLDGVALEDLPMPVPVAVTHTPEPSDTPEPTAIATSIPADTPEPTATATSIPTDAPTETASPTPTSTPVPVLCEEHIANWDFEAGPRQWRLIVTSSEQPAGRSIQHRSRVSVPPFSGDYLAWLGALPDTIFSLTTDPFSIDTTDLISATVRLRVAVLTEERPDRRPDDTGSVGLGSGHSFRDVAGLSFSEETLSSTGEWTELQADVTDAVEAGGVRQLRLVVETDETSNSWFHFDDVSLRSCRPADAKAPRAQLDTGTAARTMDSCCPSLGAQSRSLRNDPITSPAPGSLPSWLMPAITRSSWSSLRPDMARVPRSPNGSAASAIPPHGSL